MKSAILMTTLLVVSIFAGVFVLAETENVVSSSGGGGSAVAIQSNTAGLTEIQSEDVAVSISQIEPIEIQSEDVEVSLQEVESIKGHKRIGFAKVWRGHGWIDNNKDGYLITGFWASQKFAKIDVSNKEIDKVKTIRTFGILRIVKDKTYRLIRAPTTEEIENVNSVSFYVIPINEIGDAHESHTIQYEDEDILKRDSVGKLVLTRKEKFKGLTTWSGTLSFEKGNLVGSWNVELGTDINVIKPVQVKKIRRVIGEVQNARVRINEAVSISSSESSATGESYSTTGEVKKEIQIKPVKIKRKKFLFVIPTKQKILEVEVTKDGETYTREIKANEAKKIDDYTVSVGDLEDEENIELKVE